MTDKVIVVALVTMTEAEYARYLKLAALTGPGTVGAAIRSELGLIEDPYGHTTRKHISEQDYKQDYEPPLNVSMAAAVGAFIERVLTDPAPTDGPPYVHTIHHESGTINDDD